MKPAEWARKTGFHEQTVRRWCKNGTMPEGIIVRAMPNGRYDIYDPQFSEVVSKPTLTSSNNKDDSEVVLYARVSSHDQKQDLIRQTDRLKAFAYTLGHKNPRIVQEIASGMNGNRSKLNNILKDPTAKLIIVEHEDRFARMNFELVQSALEAQGREVLVVDDEEVEDDLVRDVTEVMTSFCARFYGKRGAKNRAERAMRAAEEG